MPPFSAILRALPPPTCPSTSLRSSPCGLHSPPMAPLFNLVGRHSPTHPGWQGIIPPPIQCCRAITPHPSSISRHPCPSSSGRGFVGPSFVPPPGVCSLWHRCASPSISGRSFISHWGGCVVLSTGVPPPRPFLWQRSNCRLDLS